jgi:hypothetical protein
MISADKARSKITTARRKVRRDCKEEARRIYKNALIEAEISLEYALKEGKLWFNVPFPDRIKDQTNPAVKMARKAFEFKLRSLGYQFDWDGYATEVNVFINVKTV